MSVACTTWEMRIQEIIHSLSSKISRYLSSTLCKAAKLGHARSQLTAASCFVTGLGTPVNRPAAFKLLKLAADGGNPKMMGVVSKILNCPSTSAAHGVEWNPDKASLYRDMACRFGDALTLLERIGSAGMHDSHTEGLLYLRAAYFKLVEVAHTEAWLKDPIADVEFLKKGVMEAEVLSQGRCVNCRLQVSDNANLKACTQCFTVYYCGRTCQATHWKLMHKQECQFDYPMDATSAAISRVRFVDKK